MGVARAKATVPARGGAYSPRVDAADTIAALATPPAPAARAVVRTSGPRALGVARDLAGVDVEPGVTRASLDLGDVRLPAALWAWRGPRSATGEDVVEYHVPGGPVVSAMLLRALRARGVRDATAGEFTARAYLAGKLDLAQAEGVALTIAAADARELAAARGLLAGALAERLRPARDALIDLLALCEVGLDFADEDVVALPASERAERALRIAAELRALVADAPRVEALARRPTVALAGFPNAGKSTLLNALAGRARAVASPRAGTTRDALRAEVALPRGVVELLDLAGLDEADDADVQRLARAAEASADVLAWVRAADDARGPNGLPRAPDLVVRTKGDLADVPGAVCAPTGAGLDALRARLDALCFGSGAGGAARLALNGRHVGHLAAAADALDAAAGERDDALAASALRRALDEVGAVLGRVAPDDVLGRVFASFCIGK